MSAKYSMLLHEVGKADLRKELEKGAWQKMKKFFKNLFVACMSNMEANHTGIMANHKELMPDNARHTTR